MINYTALIVGLKKFRSYSAEICLLIQKMSSQLSSFLMHSMGVIVNDKVVYKSGGYDWIGDRIDPYSIYNNIIRVWSNSACGFDYCKNAYLIWEKN